MDQSDPTTPVLLVAHDEGIDWWVQGETRTLAKHGSVEVAFPDLAGAVIASGRSPNSIDVIEATDATPRVLVEDPAARWLTPIQVAVVEGRRTLIYSKGIWLANDCATGDDECLWEYEMNYLMMLDLESGVETNVGAIGSFESSGVGIRLGGDVAGLTFYPYGEPFICSALIPIRSLLGGATPDRWIGEGSELLTGAGLDFSCDEFSRAVPSPDGSSWVEVTGGYGSSMPVRVTVRETVGGMVLFSAEVLDESVWPSWIDYDGKWIVVQGLDEGRPGSPGLRSVLVGPEGLAMELSVTGRLALWQPMDSFPG